jgi:hypothetical protein
MKLRERVSLLLDVFFALDREAYQPGDQNNQDSYDHNQFQEFSRLYGYLPKYSKIIGSQLETPDFSDEAEAVMFQIARQFRIFSGNFHVWAETEEIDEFQSEEMFTLSGELRISIHAKISDAREMVIKGDWLTEKHRGRILGILASVTREIDKEFGDFHQFLGMVEDAAETLGTAADDAAPIVRLLTGIRNAVTGERNRPLEIGHIEPPKQITDKSNDK